MVKYKITFDFDIEEKLEEFDDLNVSILELDDSCFFETFNSDDKIKEFENWINVGAADDEIIKVINISYNSFEEKTGVIEITLESKPKDEKMFADELITYLFETDYPTLEFNISGKGYKDDWDYHRDMHIQREFDIDENETVSVSSYENVNIVEI